MPPTILLNPRITLPTTRWKRAGRAACRCLGLRGAVSRHRRIRYQGLDPRGQPIDRSVEGVPCAGGAARVRLHLIGRLYPSRITDFSKFGFTEVLFPDPTPPPDD
ncbi:hypothetical protein P4234_26995 [Pseudomonas aeruginosa]|nr:hypothetical protein [Pseudomonas aeruginosa]